MSKKKKIRGNLYLVLDPQQKEEELLFKLKCLGGNAIAALQVWDNFAPNIDKDALVRKILDICNTKKIPVLINNDWELAKRTGADGIHLDDLSPVLSRIKRELGPGALIGCTCNNDLEVVRKAESGGLDYISFCSIFPSKTSNSCDLVHFETIRKAREITEMPIFLAGGIRPDNLDDLRGMDFEGVAVISGIMGAEDPARATSAYINKLKQLGK